MTRRLSVSRGAISARVRHAVDFLGSGVNSTFVVFVSMSSVGFWGVSFSYGPFIKTISVCCGWPRGVGVRHVGRLVAGLLANSSSASRHTRLTG